jgi:hypothetical protein
MGNRRDGWVNGSRLVHGRDSGGLPGSIPIGYESGSHTLVVGATGSGKTVSETWIACGLIERGHGASVIDPQGDTLMRTELKAAADQVGGCFLECTPVGPLRYNPYARDGQRDRRQGTCGPGARQVGSRGIAGIWASETESAHLRWLIVTANRTARSLVGCGTNPASRR